MKQVDFRTSRYFSDTFLFLGVVLVIGGLVLLLKSIVLAFILIFTGLTIFTTHNRFNLDFQKKEFRQYTWIWGLETGSARKFDTVEYLFIKKNRISQTMNYKSLSSTIHKGVFEGFLRFSENEKVRLATRDDKDDLLAFLRGIAEQLKVKIVDLAETT